MVLFVKKVIFVFFFPTEVQIRNFRPYYFVESDVPW